MIGTTFALRLLSGALAVLLVSGCTTFKYDLDYKAQKAPVKISTGPGKGEDLGYVTDESGGYIWSNCQQRAQMSLDELYANAKAKGADSIGNIIWDSTGTSDPGCRRGWGYLILWPLALTPVFMNTRVEAVAYKSAR